MCNVCRCVMYIHVECIYTLGRLLDDLWTIFSRLLADLLTTCGRLLADLWTTFGRLLGHLWATFGRPLDLFWTTSGALLDHFWTISPDVFVFLPPSVFRFFIFALFVWVTKSHKSRIIFVLFGLICCNMKVDRPSFYSCLYSILFLNLVCIRVTKYSKPSIILVLFGLICCNMQANSSSLLFFILCSFSIFNSLFGW